MTIRSVDLAEIQQTLGAMQSASSLSTARANQSDGVIRHDVGPGHE